MTTLRIRFEVADTGIGIDKSGAEADIRALRPGRRLDHAPLWRQWSGDHDQQAAGGTAGRCYRRRKRARRGAACSGWNCLSWCAVRCRTVTPRPHAHGEPGVVMAGDQVKAGVS